MSKIAKITTRKIYDSNSNPTIEIEICLDNGIRAVSSAPKSLFNAKEYIRHYATNAYGKNILGETIGDAYDEGVDKTIERLEEEVVPEIVSMNVNNQEGIDNKLTTLRKTLKDGFNLAVNSSLAISNTVAKAAAQANKMSLFRYIRELFSKNKYFEMPIPLINIFDGGIHTNNNLIFQSLMIAPVGAKSFKESIRIGAEIFHAAKKALHDNRLSSSVGNYGGYAPIFCLKDIKDINVVNWESITTEALDIIMKSINEAGYKPGSDALIAIDAAAESSFYDERSRYGLTNVNSKPVEITRKEIISFYGKTAEKYPVILIEDGLADDDEIGWRELNSKIGKKILISGGEIFFNQNHDREKMVRADIGSSAVISLDRSATLSEIFDRIDFAKKYRLKSVIYNGLGDTEDVIISDISVGCNVEMIRAGGFCRTERIAKYNQLLRIEEELGKDAYFYPHNLEERG